MAIEKIKILGAILELPAKIALPIQPIYLKNWVKWAELAVLFSW